MCKTGSVCNLNVIGLAGLPETDDRDLMTVFIYLLYCGGMRWQRETGASPDEGNVMLCYHPRQQQPTLLIYTLRQHDSAGSLGVARLPAGLTKG